VVHRKFSEQEKNALFCDPGRKEEAKLSQICVASWSSLPTPQIYPLVLAYCVLLIFWALFFLVTSKYTKPIIIFNMTNNFLFLFS
jgi:hypothetical protein